MRQIDRRTRDTYPVAHSGPVHVDVVFPGEPGVLPVAFLYHRLGEG